jgi:hypothetical protein
MATTAQSRSSGFPPPPPLTPSPAQERPPYLMAALTVFGTLLLYVVTLAPTTQFWDTSEYIAAAYVLGIPHPPGNPLFTLMAHVWGDLLFFVEHYAKRINLFAASTSAVAAGCWFLVGERWMRSFVPARWPRRLAALAGAIVGATAFTVWNQSVVNEKVYTVSLLSIAVVLWLIVRWDDQPEGSSHDHFLLLIVYLIALTSTNHMMGVLVGPVVIVLLFPLFKTVRPFHVEARRIEWGQWGLFTSIWLLIGSAGMESKTILTIAAILYAGAFLYAVVVAHQWGLALIMLGVAVVGISVDVFLPIRAAHFPPINEGEPTTWTALWEVLTRQQYGKVPVWQRNATLGAQLGMWWDYFSWQFARDFPANVERMFAVLFGSIGVLGAWRHWKADKRSAAAMTALVGFLTIVLIVYLNFKYGYSQYLDRRTLEREVRERDYFYIASFAVWGIWVGMGLATLMEWVRDFVRDRVPNDARRWAMATPVLLIAFIPLLANHRSASRAGETLARDFAVDLLNSVEPYGVLVTAGDNDTFPLWYAQEVEHIRQDVTVVNLSLANTDWYLRQLQRRPLADFDSTTAAAIYRGRTWTKPTSSLMSFTDVQIAALNLFYIVDKPQTVPLGVLSITLDPDRLGRPYVERADVAVMQIIKDHLGVDRPIYFSRTVGDYADRMGLRQHVEGQGFAQRLREKPVVPSDSVVMVPVIGLVNVPRTTELLFDVYHGHSAARPRPRGWVDRPSEGILTTYGLLYQTLAETLRQTDPKLAERALFMADSIFNNTDIPRMSSGN